MCIVKPTPSSIFACAGLVGLSLAVHAYAADQYDAPASYYSGATGTGSTLKSQLTTAMSTGHIERTYGDFRNMSKIIDRDPNNASNIILAYNGASVPGNWDSGSTWNREHVWPQSLQPGSASNSTRGNLGDPHALRPCNPSVNSSRGNKPFGMATTTGNHRSLGTFYFTGDVDKGDIARALFYSDTRWSSLGINLVQGVPGSNQMGDLTALIAWHYLDAPDEFERRRNHAVYSSDLNPVYFTNNRNAFIDHPEFVWSIYVDQMNDSTLWVGSSPNADGSSSMLIDVNAIVGDSTPSIPVTINKDGSDGTYYTITPTAGIETDDWGNPNAFPMNTPSDASMFTISLPAGTTATAGMSLEHVVINNLDVTTAGGTGNGANDADDVVTVQINVFNAVDASLDSSTDTHTLDLDLGTIALGSGDASQTIEFFNFGDILDGAPMDIQLLSMSGDISALTTDFSMITSVPGQSSQSIQATLTDDAEGDFSATYTFRAVNDESLFGPAAAGENLVVNLTGQVTGNTCPGDLAEPYGVFDFIDISLFLNGFTNNSPESDLNNDGEFDFLDISVFLNSYANGCP